MQGSPAPGRLFFSRTLGASLFALGIALAVVPVATSGPLVSPNEPEALATGATGPAAAAPVANASGSLGLTSIDLTTCRRLALEKQPALAAYRASLAAANAKVVALHNLGKMASLLRHDLCVRQRQAALGVVAAEARLHQAEVETLYSVTRLYWTAVYAVNQLGLAETALSKKEGAADSLYTLRQNLETLRRKRQKEDVWLKEQFSSITTVAEGRKIEAEQGVQRALAALREAIGLEPGCPLAVKDKDLPDPAADVTRKQIVTLALEHRGEIGQAGTAAEVAALEIEAQCLIKGPRAETFATGSDLHSQPLPAASFGDDYRPAAVGVEMPATLVGPPCLRTEQAHLLHERTLAVLAKTRGLVALEAEDAYLRWVESRDRLPSFKQAQEEADRALKGLILTLQGENGKDAEPRASKATLSDLLIASVRRIMTRVEYDQARLRLVLNLAALERVTGGAFCPAYDKADNGKDNGAGTGGKKE